MALNTVDARGRSCPEPVVLTRKALEQSPEGVQVILDNATSRDNVKRFAESKSYKVTVKDEGQDFLLKITK
ncbi:MAG TPA: sulfurtransferase TusA family protein [Limnochordia bacterium]|nr:sulfurtransferase TusA family protein [Limnochordia bacterium]